LSNDYNLIYFEVSSVKGTKVLALLDDAIDKMYNFLIESKN